MSNPVYLPSAWNSNLTGYYSVQMAGNLFEYQGASHSYSLSAPDANTVRFELHDGDQHKWDVQAGHNSERDELAERTTMSNSQPIHISYGFTLEPGAANTAGWIVLGQLHQGLDDSYSAGPALSVNLDGEHMVIQGHITGPDGKPQTVVYYEDPYNIQRGHQYSMDIKVQFDPSGQNGHLVVTRDGVEIVDYKGVLGDANMTSSYWAEGIYRDGSATETVAADYSNLQISTGSSVTFPSASSFTAAPQMTTAVVSSAAPMVHAAASANALVSTASGASFGVALGGTAKAGSTVSLYENQVLVGSGVADDAGHVVVQLSGLGAGVHSFNASAVDASGHASAMSASFDVAIGTAAQIVAQGATLNKDANLDSVYLTDSHILAMPNGGTLSNFRHYTSLVSKIQGTVLFQNSYAVTGKAWDRQVDTYSSGGSLVSTQRIAAGKLYMGINYDGDWTKNYNYNIDGSHFELVSYKGAIKSNSYYDANNHAAYTKLSYDAGGSRTDYFDANGGVTKTVIARPDGSALTTSYVTGKSYASEQDYSSGGSVVATGQYDSAGHLLRATDSVAGKTTTFNWDAGGHLTGYRVVASDNSYSVTTLGTDGVSVVKTDHFSAKGALIGTDKASPATVAGAAITGDVASVQAFGASAALTLPSSDVAAALNATGPTITGTNVAADAMTGGSDVTISGTGKLGTQVTVLDGSTAIGTAAVDATGHFTLVASAGTAGIHQYTAVTTDAVGLTTSSNVAQAQVAAAPVTSPAPVASPASVTSPASVASPAPVAAAPVAAAPAAVSAAASVAAAPVTDVLAAAPVALGTTLQFSSARDARNYANSHPTATVPTLLHSYSAASKSGFDHEASTFDLSGTQLQYQRFLNGALTQDTASVGAWSASLNAQADGSSSISIHGAAGSGTILSFGANGSETSQQIFFTDGSKRTDNVGADGQVTLSTMFNSDGTRLQTAYTSTGGLSWQNIFNKAGALDQVRYDGNGHVTSVNDAGLKEVTLFSYDGGGHAVSARTMEGDGTYSITTFAGDVAKVTKVDYYSAKGAFIKETAAGPVAATLNTIAAANAAAQGHTPQSGFITAAAGGHTVSAGADTFALIGANGADTLVGNGNNQILVAGQGTDILTGGGGSDLFYFTPGHVGSATGLDRITDFTQGDRIDLSAFENSIANHAGFTFVGTSDYTSHAGEVHTFEQNGNTLVGVDLNGDGHADFTLQLDGHHSPSSTDFLF